MIIPSEGVGVVVRTDNCKMSFIFNEPVICTFGLTTLNDDAAFNLVVELYVYKSPSVTVKYDGLVLSYELA